MVYCWQFSRVGQQSDLRDVNVGDYFLGKGK